MSDDHKVVKKKIIKKKILKNPIVTAGLITIIAIAGIIGGLFLFMKIPEIPDNIFICALSTGPTSIDPLHNPGPNYANNILIDQIAEGLFDFDQNKSHTPIIPNLALNGNWSLDHLNFTCALRRNVTFHDGTPFNATAVKWNFDRLHYLLKTKPYEDIWDWYYMYLTSNNKTIINHTEIIDDFTIRFVLNQPYVPIKDLLAIWNSYILSPTSTPETDFLDIETDLLIGTGPYILKSCELDDWGFSVKTDLHGNSDYWGGEPSFDKLTFLEKYRSGERMEEMLSGEFSYAEGVMDDDVLDVFINTPGFTVVSKKTLGVWYLAMNNNDFNATLRKAIAYAFNYTSFINTIHGGHAERVKSPLTEMRYAEDLDMPYYNITRAREILKEVDWPGTMTFSANDNITSGNEWELVATSPNPLSEHNFSVVIGSWGQPIVANMLFENLKQIGVKINIINMSWVEWNQEIEAGELEIYIIGWVPVSMDPVDMINSLYSSKFDGQGNSFNFNDSLIQAWMEEALQKFNETEREELYFDIQERLVELNPIIWLDSTINYHIWDSDVKGIPNEGAAIKFVLKYAYL